MQLRMLARRSAGAVTILGDIAQSAGPVPYPAGTSSLPHLAPEARPAVEELRLAYRVPSEVMELALPLLPLIAPDVAAADRLPRRRRAAALRPRRARHSSPPRPCARRAARRAGTGARRLIAAAGLLAELEPLLPRPDTAFDELAAPIQALTREGGEGSRVRPGRPGRAGRDRRRGRAGRGSASALRRAHEGDEDPRRRPRRAAAARARGYQRERRPRRLV